MSSGSYCGFVMLFLGAAGGGASRGGVLTGVFLELGEDFRFGFGSADYGTAVVADKAYSALSCRVMRSAMAFATGSLLNRTS